MRPDPPAAVPRPPERYLLDGVLRLDVGRVRLERDGREIPLPRLSFDLLVALVRAAPDVLTYDMLMAQVWPGLIVRPETISQRVKLLREALDDDAKSPRFVAGVRGRGYHLACRVQRLDPVEAERAAPFATATVDAAAAGDARRTRTPRRAVAVATAVVLVLALAAIAWQTLRPAPFPSRPLLLAPFRDSGSDPDTGRLARSTTDAVRSALAGRHGLDLVLAAPAPLRAQAWLPPWPSRRTRIEGDVQRSGARIRASARLLDGDAVIATVSRDAPATELDLLQEDIARHLARAIAVEAGARAALHRTGGGWRGRAARLEFERGVARYQRWRADDNTLALAHFLRSTELDPGNARAWAWRAMATQRAAQFGTRRSQAAEPEAQAMFARALRLDPRLGEARAFAAFNAGRVANLPALRAAIGLDPSSAESHALLAQRLGESDPRQALAAIDRAIALSPQTTRFRYLRALLLWLDPATSAQGETEMRAVIDADPDFAPAAARLSQWLWQRRLQPAEAVALSEHALRVDPGTGWPYNGLCRMYLDLADPDAARDVIARAPAPATQACRVDLAVFEGDWRDAGRLATTASAEIVQSGGFSAGMAGALARHAADGRAGEPVLALLRALYGDHPERLDTDPGSVPERAALLLQLHAQRGDTPAHDRVRRRLAHWLAQPRPGPGRESYPARALLLAAEGRDDAALDALLAWAREGHSPYWWYVYRHDPLWQRHRHDPRFQQALALETAYVERQRSLLATYRAQGQVPVRAAARVAAR